MRPGRTRYECPLCGWFSVKGRPERKLLNHMAYYHRHLRPDMREFAVHTQGGWACWCGENWSAAVESRPDHPDALERLLQHMRDVSGGVIPHVYACLLGVEHG